MNHKQCKSHYDFDLNENCGFQAEESFVRRICSVVLKTNSKIHNKRWNQTGRKKYRKKHEWTLQVWPQIWTNNTKDVKQIFFISFVLTPLLVVCKQRNCKFNEPSHFTLTQQWNMENSCRIKKKICSNEQKSANKKYNRKKDGCLLRRYIMCVRCAMCGRLQFIQKTRRKHEYLRQKIDSRKGKKPKNRKWYFIICVYDYYNAVTISVRQSTRSFV